MRRKWLSILIAIVALQQGAMANSYVPSDAEDGFASRYDDLFRNTMAWARMKPLTFWYRYAGRSPVQPPPGWVRVDIDLQNDLFSADRLWFNINGNDRIECEGYPYWAITLEQARRIANAKDVEVIAFQEKTPRRKGFMEKWSLPADSRKALADLVGNGQGWKPPARPWEMPGVVTLAFETRPLPDDRVTQLRKLLGDAVRLRTEKKEPFILVSPGGILADHPVRGTNWFEPTARYFDPNEPLRIVENAKPEVAEKGYSLGKMAAIAARQQTQAMVLFIADGPPLTDPDVVEQELRQESCRLFVVWLGDADAQGERVSQLRALVWRTRGGFITPSPAP